MMKTHLNGFFCATLALLLASHAAHAAIIKLDLGGGPDPDLIYSGSVLAAFSDGNGLTLGSQDTGIVYGDFLSGLGTTSGSYSLQGLATSGPLVVTNLPGPIQQVTQPLSGGNFQVYGAANNLLLNVSLATSTSFLTGVVGSPTGAVISVTNGTVVGGSLAPLINPNSITFNFTLTNISGGTLIVDAGNILHSFTASATGEIGASVPEPMAAILLVLGALPGWRLRRRRG
jgi:hypothetical protein